MNTPARKATGRAAKTTFSLRGPDRLTESKFPQETLVRLSDDDCYRALRTHDARFDGRFFVAVRSTGIYCRPVCTAKTPKRSSCTFYAHTALAERDGYRPCLRCRPELAPGNSAVDARQRLASQAAQALDDGALGDDALSALASRMGISDRHLRRVFAAEYGVSPIEYRQTQRLLLAKRLLTDSPMAITDIAFASGFASVRRFNAAMQERYRFAPSALRDKRTLPTMLRFTLTARPPYAYQSLLAFLGARAIPGIETIDGERYRRLLRACSPDGREHVGVMQVEPCADGVELTLDAALAPAVAQVIPRVRRVFDLDARPDEIASALGEMARVPGLRVPGAFDGFELAVRAVLGQQVSVKAARTLAMRFVAAFGDIHGDGELHRLFPLPSAIAQVDAAAIAELGIVRQRAESIVRIAKALHSGALQLHPAADVEQTYAALVALPGIGDWTAQYIIMRALHWPDAFPAADLALMKALDERSPARLRARAETWRPWRAYAVMQAWL